MACGGTYRARGGSINLTGWCGGSFVSSVVPVCVVFLATPSAIVNTAGLRWLWPLRTNAQTAACTRCSISSNYQGCASFKVHFANRIITYNFLLDTFTDLYSLLACRLLKECAYYGKDREDGANVGTPHTYILIITLVYIFNFGKLLEKEKQRRA